jgi:pectate lyase
LLAKFSFIYKVRFRQAKTFPSQSPMRVLTYFFPVATPLCRFLFPLFLAALTVSGSEAGLPAFPGAEGAGALTTGGRFGRAIYVTNLQDSGPGSFRAAVTAGGERTVLFAVGGRIELKSPVIIDKPDLTIAGQTAPGDGICISGDTVTIDAANVIVRYLRFRRGNLESRDDALNAVHSPGQVIIDHCSFSWGLDENVSLYRYMSTDEDGNRIKGPIENVTIQWCISSEALDLHDHAYGATWGGRNVSHHHNLFAHNTARNASVGWGDHMDFRNNVIFNWGHRTLDGGDRTSMVNVVNNFFKPGPATQSGELQYRIARPQIFRDFAERNEEGRWHVSGNFVAGNSEVSANNWAGGVQFDAEDADESLRAAALATGPEHPPVPAPPVRTDDALTAYERVLQHSGAVLPRRDPVDRRLVAEVRSGQPTFGNGIINTPADVGGWPDYRGGIAPLDGDHDGMPDTWERRHGLDETDPADGIRDSDEDGYTNLEEYLNGTDPTVFIDYRLPENNVNTLH